MPTLNHAINALSRCGALFRGKRLENSELGAYDPPYLFHIYRNPNISQEALGRALALNKSSVTRRLTALEEKGFVTRTPSTEDQRVLLVNLTARAMEALPYLRTISREWMSAITEGFTDEETAQFHTLLARALANARAAIDREVPPCN